MTDSTDDVDWFDPDTDEDELEDFEIKKLEVIQYCYPHLEKMWAAKIVGILLDCDFRDAKEFADRYIETLENE